MNTKSLVKITGTRSMQSTIEGSKRGQWTQNQYMGSEALTTNAEVRAARVTRKVFLGT